jgi:hypothetical protein
MNYTIHKLTYSDGRAYSYHVSDDAGRLHYVAEPTGLLLPSPTRLIEFFDPDHNLAGRLQPPDIAPWQRARCYEVFLGERKAEEEEEPLAVIRERWNLVDILLLRLPRYEVSLGEYRYVARGSRYGEHFYEVLRPCEEEGVDEEVEEEEIEEETDEGVGEPTEEEIPWPSEVKVGEIRRPAAGASYVVEIEAAPLRQALLVLAALVILIDVELFS